VTKRSAGTSARKHTKPEAPAPRARTKADLRKNKKRKAVSVSESEGEADDGEADDGVGLGFELGPTAAVDKDLESDTDSDEDDKEATPECTQFNNGQHNSIATLTKTVQPKISSQPVNVFVVVVFASDLTVFVVRQAMVST
jgi:hypothetical protein